MKTLRLFFCVLALMLASVAHASDQGRWLCDDCDLRLYAETPYGTYLYADSNVVRFIKNIVNKSAYWSDNDNLLVCDGWTCMSMFYYYGNFYFVSNTADTRRPYKNAPNGAIAYETYNGGPPSMNYQLMGHWEYTDYYTTVCAPTCGPSRYNGTDPQFVIDGAVIFMFNMQPSWGGSSAQRNVIR